MALDNKKVWTTEEREEMKEYVKLEYPTLKITEINQVLKFMEKLAIPLEEAIETLYFDKGTKTDEIEQEQKKAKKLNAQAKKELKEKKAELKKKADQTKTDVLNDVMEILQKTQVNPQKVGTGSICFVGTDGQFYTLKLTKNKSCPNGYEVK